MSKPHYRPGHKQTTALHKPPTKIPPSPDLIIFAANGSNFSEARDALARHCLVAYGDVSTFITTGVRVVRPAPTPARIALDYPGFGATDRTRILLSLMSDYRSQERDDKSASTKMFGLFQQVMEDEGLERVKANAGWAAAVAGTLAFEEWVIMSSVHTTHISNVAPGEALYNAMSRYNKCVQLPHMSDSNFREAITTSVAVLRALDHPNAPDDASVARHMLHNLDKMRHGEYIADVLNAERRNPNSFPATLQAVLDGLRAFIPTTAVQQARANVLAYSTGVKAKAEPPGPCPKCGQAGHWKRDCPQLKKPTGVAHASAAAQPAGTDKTSAAESVKGKAKGSKKAKKAYSTAVSVTDGAASSYWDQVFLFPARIRIGLYPASTRNPRLISIDSMADHSFSCVMDLVAKPRAQSFLIDSAIGTDVGDTIGHLPGFGDVAYTPKSGANGLAISDATSRYRVVFDQEVAFTVHINASFALVFAYDKSTKIYSCLFTDEVLERLAEHEHTIAARPVTVRDLEMKYSKREIQRAQDAVTMAKRLYYPSRSAMTGLATDGDMLNVIVTGADIALAETVYGNAAYHKGRDKFLGPVATKDVLVPTANRKEQHVFADVIFWHQLPFILFIVKPLMLLLTQYIGGPQTVEAMKEPFVQLCEKIKSRGFSATRIVTDPQSSIAALVGRVPYHIDVVGSGTHVADAEVEARLLKEKLRSMESTLPWPVPKRIVRWEVYGATAITNMFRRLDRGPCPRVGFTGVKLDYKRDLRSDYGEYCEVSVASGSASGGKEAARSVSAISLCGSGNAKGSWWFFDIQTMKPFLADRWTALPTTDLVIERMNYIHDLDEVAFAKKRPTKLQGALKETAAVSTRPQRRVKDMVALPTPRDNVPLDPSGPVPVDNSDDGRADVAAGTVPTDNLDDVTDDVAAEPPSTQPEEDESAVPDPLPPPSASDGQESFEPDDSVDIIENVENPTETFGHQLLAARSAAGQRTSSRTDDKKRFSARWLEFKILDAYKLSVAKALKRNEHTAKEAILAELQQMVDKEVWEVVDKSKLTKKQLRSIIRSSLFLKDKFDASGNFVKVKGRVVAGGDKQDKSLYDDLSSPTVSHEAIMIVLAIAAAQRRKVATVDITGAYLECHMPDGDEVLMELDATLTRFLQEIDPSIVPFKDETGRVVVKLKRALYGCVQSALLWYNKLKSVLIGDGFVQNDYDACVFNKTIDGEQVTVAFHVDDLLMTSVSETSLDRAISLLQSNFGSVSVNKGLSHSYLAMNLAIGSDGICVDMIAYITKATEGRGSGRKVNTPATDKLFDISEDSPKLSAEHAKQFHSDIAKLLYVAKRTRLEILTCVSFLSSRVAEPTEEDQAKLQRLIDYLIITKDAVLHLRAGTPVDLVAHIDASFATHMDGTSRTGVVLMVCNVGIAGWSGKQKLTTKSSTEAEVVALSDGLTHVLWAREFLIDQGHDISPVLVYQDNQGVLSIMQTGRASKHRTKHLNVRYFFAKDRVAAGEIRLEYLPTDKMVADLLTKPVVGEAFKRLVKLLYGGY